MRRVFYLIPCGSLSLKWIQPPSFAGRLDGAGDEENTKDDQRDAKQLSHTEWQVLTVVGLSLLDELDEKSASLKAQIQALPKQSQTSPTRYRSYVPNLIKKTLADLR